jgi:hypothetical protein
MVTELIGLEVEAHLFPLPLPTARVKYDC